MDVHTIVKLRIHIRVVLILFLEVSASVLKRLLVHSNSLLIRLVLEELVHSLDRLRGHSLLKRHVMLALESVIVIGKVFIELIGLFGFP